MESWSYSIGCIIASLFLLAIELWLHFNEKWYEFELSIQQPYVRFFQINLDCSYRIVDEGNGTVFRYHILGNISLWCKAYFCSRLRVVTKLHVSINHITRAPSDISSLARHMVTMVATTTHCLESCNSTD